MSNEKSEISTFMGSFCPKSMIFKTDLWFEKWREGFGKFLPDHSKV